MDKDGIYNEQSLIFMAQRGDSKAYYDLIAHYGPKIEIIITSSIYDKSAVYDLKQDVLLKIYRFLPGFKQKCRFSSWIYRITDNTVKNYYRLIANQRSLEERYAIASSEGIQSTSPEWSIMYWEIGHKIGKALAKLSRELRTCYELYAINGQSYESIAKKLKCPIGTVRSRIFRARKILSEYLE